MIRLYAKYEETVKYFWFAILIERNIFLDFEIGNNKDVLYWHIKDKESGGQTIAALHFQKSVEAILAKCSRPYGSSRPCPTGPGGGR